MKRSPKTDPRVDAYIADSAEFARPILRHLRAVVHRGCPDAQETVKWGMPYFEYAGQLLCGMAAFKAHCAFGFWHQGMEKVLGADGAKADTAMGSLGRIASLDDLPPDRTMLRYLKEAAKLNASGTPARPRPVERPRVVVNVPADLAAALKKHKAAAAMFEKFSPSNRRDYVAWLSEAKHEETRQKRLATALEWMAEGKPRNWKYLKR